MPFATEPKARPSGTGRGCRAVVAAGCSSPGASGRCSARSRSRTSRARSISTTRRASARRFALWRTRMPIGSPRCSTTTRSSPSTSGSCAETRSAAGTPAHAQDKTAIRLTGSVRFTAPSVVFRRGEQSAVAGGWQPLLSYDTVLANFAPELERVPPPDSPGAAARVLPGWAHDGRGRAPSRRGLGSGSRHCSSGGVARGRPCDTRGCRLRRALVHQLLLGDVQYARSEGVSAA